MRVIKVPKTPKSAFNPQRPAGLLLQSQIEHLEAALQNQMPAIPLARSATGLTPARSAPAAGMRSAPPVAAPPVAWTEGDAAAYIAELTSRLEPAASPAATVQNAVAADAEEQAAARSRARAAKTGAARPAAKRAAKKSAARKTAPRKKASRRASRTGAAGKTAVRKAPARKTATRKTAVRKTAARKAAGRSAATRTSASTSVSTGRRRSSHTSTRAGGRKR